MEIITKHEVYQDSLTGIYYENPQRRTVSALSNDASYVTKGYVLEPFNDHPDLDFSHYQHLRKTVNFKAQFGVRNELSEKLFVPMDVFESRFREVGIFYKLVDLDKELMQYTEENCDFSNRAWVAASVKRLLLQNAIGSLSDCLVYTLFQEYTQHTKNTFDDSKQLPLFD